MHRDKYIENLISDVFHSSIGYLFEKVSQGIHSPSDDNRSLGLSMLNSIKETYANFETALSERNELNDYTSYDLDEYKHVISTLKSYLSGENESMHEKDARIYYFYLHEQHKHFVKIAEEVDSEYCKKV